ncbi:hypothetical protein DH2020_020560 [Rehmannia glutinosa]|uniref:PTC1-like winged helix-turn-helix domain-containing protein n=1 Tax=Rehmannia glutinosa TaxID=99300 RepID=A0ABR0WGH0_REHGL
MASIVFHRPSNKRKNRVNSDKLFDFGNFAIPESMNTTLSGAFRDNIRNFLQNFAEIEEYTVHEKPVWNTSLFSEKEGVFSLYTVEETVENSIDPFCDLCELSGWGHHFVCKRKYYFIIPAKDDWNTPLDEDFALYDSHYLYGLIHCNGYGHLICINGLKNNSNLFTADDSMELWERLCTLLKARWSAKRLENVLFVIIDQLKEHKPNGMSRQELRDEARKSIGDTGLIDFVLKSIKCFAVDNQIIRRSVNPLSRLTEFTINEISSIEPGLNLTKDLQFLTKNVLAAGYSETQVILASNHFVKEWPVVTGKIVDQSMKLICKVLPSFDEMETELKSVYRPVDQIGGLRKIEDEKVLFSVLEPGVQVWVRGHGLDLHTELRYEDGGRKTSTVSNGGGGQ